MAGTSVNTDLTQEIRFAVVMYGGSSLAVYMNGVAQELLRLVRATAPKPEDWTKPHVENPSGSEKIYRDLGRMLRRGQPAKLELDGADPIQTRFVIDVLSGTSAGGINGVFLAKALANDLDLNSLRDIWVNTADFGVIMNDGQGEGTPQKPPRSLVNSPLMYSKLLDALRAMDRDVALKKSPYADQLDLYTTFTDIQGQTIALRLADIVATERQHLHSFRFSYSTAQASGEERNDFTREFNPFLAFAARCTSAHPAAFEPMTLEDIRKAGCNPEYTVWRKFYEAYLQPVRVGKADASQEEGSTDRLAQEFLTRPLSDGGVLDNSPFSFAIDQLQFRNTRIPVDRKLIYIEPSPDHPELEQDRNKKPDAIQNAVISVSSLPSYQFIQDDIRRILDRNLLIERVNRIIRGVEDDYATRGVRLESLTGEDFGKASIDDLIKLMGPAWGGYQRLRVAETTDDLVSIVTRAAGFNDDSDEFSAIRYLVRAWRSENYAVRPVEGKDNKRTENRFLYYFDIKRHVRRLKFVLKKAAELSCFDADSERVVTVAAREFGFLWDDMRNDKNFRQDARERIYEAVQGLSDILKDFYIKQRVLTAPVRTSVEHPLKNALEALHLKSSILRDLLEEPSESARMAVATRFVRDRAEDFRRLSSAIIKEFQIIREASRRVRGGGEDNLAGVLGKPDEATSLPSTVVLSTLRFYYDNFDHYDMVSYPILYSTNVGDELDPIEVFRISPEDATQPEMSVEDRRRKLAGLSLGHFGAFLDARYRVNDILWGRLDCADRLITALMRSAPAPADAAGIAALEQKRVELIRKAQEAIVIEEAGRFDESIKKELGLNYPEATTEESVQRESAARALEDAKLPDGVTEYLLHRLREEDPLERFLRNYKSLHEENPQKLLHVAGRASRIIGQMLDGIANERNVSSPHLKWVTRLMRVFWGFVEVALPDSFWNLLTRHLLKLIYLFEALMILGGVLLSSDPVQRFGLTALGVTAAAHTFVLILQDLARRRDDTRRGATKRALVAIFGSALLLAALFGIAVLGGILGIERLWPVAEYFHQLFSKPAQ